MAVSFTNAFIIQEEALSLASYLIHLRSLAIRTSSRLLPTMSDHSFPTACITKQFPYHLVITVHAKSYEATQTTSSSHFIPISFHSPIPADSLQPAKSYPIRISKRPSPQHGQGRDFVQLVQDLNNCNAN